MPEAHGEHQHSYIANNTKDDYLKRLRRIEGQARGLQRMVEEEKYCIDILTQVSAMTKALEAVALGLLDEHMAHCVVDAVARRRRGGADQAQGSLRRHRASRSLLNIRTHHRGPVMTMSQTSTYTVTGMTCGHCVASVTEEVQEIPGVEDVDGRPRRPAPSPSPVPSPSMTPPSRPPSRKPATSSHEHRGQGRRLPGRHRCGLRRRRRRRPGRRTRRRACRRRARHGARLGRRSRHEGGHGDETTSASTAEEVPGGLMVSQDGYTLALAEPVAPAGEGRPVQLHHHRTRWCTR